MKVSYTGGEAWRGAGPFPQQSPSGKGIWGDYQFVFGNKTNRYDFWVIVDEIPRAETCTVPKRNTLFLTSEPPHVGSYPIPFLNQFGTVATCHQSIIANPFVRANKIVSHPALAWFANKTYDELSQMKTFPKTKCLSLITTTKDKKRYEFALAMKDHFGNQLDLLGRGINNIPDKWDAHAQYQYSIVLENGAYPDYISEKLTDCYLAITYPFYYGGNIGKYYPSGAFSRIDIDDIEGSIKKIEDTIADGDALRDAAYPLRLARNRSLNLYSFFPTVISIIENNPDWFDEPGTNLASVTISDKWRMIKNAGMFAKKTVARFR